jgi:EAL domain-containing protein (putative c-di-GMP-specific phosphodiesterase class I)
VHYQPIVAMESGRLTGFEALVRWRHPQRGLIPPNDFIPMAEETGMIVPIGQWVLRESCRQLGDWQSRYSQNPPLSVSVNLSRRQLLEPDLLSQVRQILSETQITPGSLILEITESTIIENFDVAIAQLKQLRDLQIRLHMDDFGTGYSSLSCLRRLPLDGLKIDRAFVSTIGPSIQHAAIIHAIVDLAHHLRMQVIAEGVETHDQLAQLLTMGCDHAQGYLFAKPLAAKDAEALLDKSRGDTIHWSFHPSCQPAEMPNRGIAA